MTSRAGITKKELGTERETRCSPVRLQTSTFQLEAPVGQPVVLQCNFSGNPPPLVTWTTPDNRVLRWNDTQQHNGSDWNAMDDALTLLSSDRLQVRLERVSLPARFHGTSTSSGKCFKISGSAKEDQPGDDVLDVVGIIFLVVCHCRLPVLVRALLSWCVRCSVKIDFTKQPNQ